jgi:hypothetical protein
VNDTSQQMNYITIYDSSSSDGSHTILNNCSDITMSNFDINLSSVAIEESAYTITSNDTISTITLSGSDSMFTSHTINTSFFDDISPSPFAWGDDNFINNFPEWGRVQDMCSKYPGLEIALRNFQTIYTLVKDDYDAPKDQN